MSKLEKRKTRARYETGATVFDRRTRPVIVELHVDYLELKLKGTRTSYAVPYSQIFDFAMKKAQHAASVARREARRAAKKNEGA